MNKLIISIRKRCEEKLKEAIILKNNEEINMYNTITTFLMNDRCFTHVNRITSISILEMLGYSEDESYKIYDELNSYENIKGDFEFMSENKDDKQL